MSELRNYGIINNAIIKKLIYKNYTCISKKFINKKIASIFKRFQAIKNNKKKIINY